MVTMLWLVDSVDEAAIAARGVAAIGNEASIHRGAPAEAPAAALRFVFADRLHDVLASVPATHRTAFAERVIVVNADRGGVLELLEATGAAGAIECEEDDCWTSTEARMFVRKQAVPEDQGTRITGPGRESESYVLWTDPHINTRTCTLAQLLGTVASLAKSYASRNDAYHSTVAQAVEHGLPPVAFRFVIGRTSMMPRPFPSARCYVAAAGPPGGPVLFDVWAADDPESVFAADDELRVVRRERVVIGGVERDAMFCDTEASSPMTRVDWCVVAIGPLVLRFGTRGQVLAHPSLKIIADSFRIVEE